MPLLSILRFLGMLLSWIILGFAVYLIWSWYDGETLLTDDGDLITVRENWLLWVGLGLTAWSFLGRFVVPMILAKPDRHPTRRERGAGQMFAAPSGSLYVEEHGPPSAPTIILTHGWSLDATAWYYARRDLEKTFRLVTWDLPGMGRSKPHSRAAIALPTFAADLRALIMQKGKGRVVLVGHSIGGMTIQTLVRDDPAFFEAHVAGVVLLNTTYTNPLKTIIFSRLMSALRKPLLEPAMQLTKLLEPIAWASAWQSYLSGSTHIANRFGFGKHVTRSQLEHVTLLTTKNSPGNQAQGNLAMFDWDATGALARTNVPVLVIGGTLDIITKPAASDVIAKSAPQGEVFHVDDVNHMGFMELPGVYNEAIAAFATDVTRPTGPDRGV